METTQKFASMSEVVMKKQELLNKLIENKAKHDIILATAVSGYWDLARSLIEKKQKNLINHVDEWKIECNQIFENYYRKVETKEELPVRAEIKSIHFDTALGLIYPQDHSQDYNRAIYMMESSIYEDVRLTVEEYDAYILNNWEWKNNFMQSNSLYVNSVRSKLGATANLGTYSGLGKMSTGSSYNASYNNTVNATYEMLRSSPSGYFASF